MVDCHLIHHLCCAPFRCFIWFRSASMFASSRRDLFSDTDQWTIYYPFHIIQLWSMYSGSFCLYIK